MTKLFTIILFAALFACAAEQPVSTEGQQTASKQTEPKTTVVPGRDGPRDKVSLKNEKAVKESLKIQLVNKETGEIRYATPDEIELTIKEGERYTLIPESPEKQVHHEQLELRNSDGEKVAVKLDRVTLIEYWNEDAMGSNQFWSKMRDFERKYADNPQIQILSIYHNPVYSGREAIAYGNQIVKKYELPKNLYFDTMAALPDKMYVPGGVSYMLIDHRRQMTHAGRGGFAACEQVFEAVENALAFQRSRNPVSSVMVNGEPTQ